MAKSGICGISKMLLVYVGIHRGSALTLVLIRDTVTRDIQHQVSYTMLYADVSYNKTDLEKLVKMVKRIFDNRDE